MKIEVVRPSELTEGELAAWTRLQGGRPGLGTPFLSPGWALAVERAYGDCARARVAVVHEGGTPAGFLPVRAGRITAMPLGAPMCDYQGLVAEPGLRCDPRDLVRALGVQRYDFTHMVGDDPSFAPYGRGREESFLVDLSDGRAGWEARRKAAGSGLFKDVGRKRRKLEREVGEVVFTARSGSRADFETLLAWKRAQFRSTGQTDVFDAGWTLGLVEDLFRREEKGCGGALFTLHAGDKLLAAHFHLLGAGVVHGWLVTHDASFDIYSPGLQLFDHVLTWMDGRYGEFDFGPVPYGFKDRFSDSRRPITHGFVGRPSPATLVRAAQYGVRGTAERLPLGRASAWPGKAMRRVDLWRGLN
ncbi:MAG TPA: GNAT family N-acetyltransferase [Caulobacteraceae bacterium]|nr:GNAT family N-acetyltransferase [Caulobacteraceae bacterium]